MFALRYWWTIDALETCESNSRVNWYKIWRLTDRSHLLWANINRFFQLRYTQTWNMNRQNKRANTHTYMCRYSNDQIPWFRMNFRSKPHKNQGFPQNSLLDTMLYFKLTLNGIAWWFWRILQINSIRMFHSI